MENQELIEALAKTGFMTLKSVDNVNHKPHPYMIGSRHVVFGADHCGGVLGIEAIEKGEKRGIGCAMPNCNLSYAEHTSDKVAFLELTKQLTQEQANTTMMNIQYYLEKEKIDGICMVDTPEQFRIIYEEIPNPLPNNSLH